MNLTFKLEGKCITIYLNKVEISIHLCTCLNFKKEIFKIQVARNSLDVSFNDTFSRLALFHHLQKKCGLQTLRQKSRVQLIRRLLERPIMKTNI